MKGKGREREGEAIGGEEKAWGRERNTAGGVLWFHVHRFLFSVSCRRVYAVQARWVGSEPTGSLLEFNPTVPDVPQATRGSIRPALIDI